MVKFGDVTLEEASTIENSLKDTPKKPLKRYEPLSFEVVTFSEDVIISSTFDTKGIYDLEDGWFNSN